MKKILKDRLPNIIHRLWDWNSQDNNWDNLSAEKQKQILLDTHEKFLDTNDELIKLILEMEVA